MTDKELWIVVRQALLMIVSAIEKKFSLESKRVIYIHTSEKDAETVSHT
jgi:hypothetical protein